MRRTWVQRFFPTAIISPCEITVISREKIALVIVRIICSRLRLVFDCLAKDFQGNCNSAIPIAKSLSGEKLEQFRYLDPRKTGDKSSSPLLRKHMAFIGHRILPIYGKQRIRISIGAHCRSPRGNRFNAHQRRLLRWSARPRFEFTRNAGPPIVGPCTRTKMQMEFTISLDNSKWEVFAPFSPKASIYFIGVLFESGEEKTCSLPLFAKYLFTLVKSANFLATKKFEKKVKFSISIKFQEPRKCRVKIMKCNEFFNNKRLIKQKSSRMFQRLKRSSSILAQASH